jgi:hypothetical protein
MNRFHTPLRTPTSTLLFYFDQVSLGQHLSEECLILGGENPGRNSQLQSGCLFEASLSTLPSRNQRSMQKGRRTKALEQNPEGYKVVEYQILMDFLKP